MRFPFYRLVFALLLLLLQQSSAAPALNDIGMYQWTSSGWRLLPLTPAANKVIGFDGTGAMTVQSVSNAMLSGSISLSKLATDPLARANHTGTQTLSTISDAGTAAAKNWSSGGNAGADNGKVPAYDGNGGLRATSAITIVHEDDATQYLQLGDSSIAIGQPGSIPDLTIIPDSTQTAPGILIKWPKVTGSLVSTGDTATLPLAALVTNPLARANHTGTQTMSTISDAGSLATLSAVTTTQITDGTIVNADINPSAAIALSKLATSTSANLASIISDETGTGVLVFGTSPDFTTGITIGGIAVPTISNTAAISGKTFTLPHSTLTYAATTNIDASVDEFRTVTLTGNITFSTSNLAAGRSKTIRIIGDGSSRTLAFPGGWTFVGAAAPTSLAANKTAILTITAFGSTDSTVIAAYAVQP
jgi:hypothetical protein